MVYVMHFMIDVLSVLKKVSNAFQERDATAADIHTQLSSVCAVLEKYQSTDGPHLSKVNSDDLSEYESVQLQQQGRLFPVNKTFSTYQLADGHGKKI